MWSAGWVFRNPDSSRPGWSGFMQHVSPDSHSGKSDITLLPIIDLNPSDSTCIHSTLRFIANQASKLNIVTPCIIFDQPLWLKAVDICKSESLPIFCQLGGFHMLMSFLGSIGNLMAGSGFAEVLEECYGPNTVLHMMSGKAIARALRGYFLVDSALRVLLVRLLCHLTMTMKTVIPVC